MAAVLKNTRVRSSRVCETQGRVPSPCLARLRWRYLLLVVAAAAAATVARRSNLLLLLLLLPSPPARAAAVPSLLALRPPAPHQRLQRGALAHAPGHTLSQNVTSILRWLYPTYSRIFVIPKKSPIRLRSAHALLLGSLARSRCGARGRRARGPWCGRAH